MFANNYFQNEGGGDGNPQRRRRGQNAIGNEVARQQMIELEYLKVGEPARTTSGEKIEFRHKGRISVIDSAGARIPKVVEANSVEGWARHDPQLIGGRVHCQIYVGPVRIYLEETLDDNAGA